VAFAARHPRWRGQLQLAELAGMYVRSPARRRFVRAAYRNPGRVRAAVDGGMRTLPVLERLRLRGAWSRMLGRLMMAQYLLGVIDAEPSVERFAAAAAEIVADSGERVTIELDSPGPVALPERPGPLEVCVAEGGRVLACVPGTLPMRQWDWDELIDRLIAAADGGLGSGPA
jgi:hypothetical protein